MNFFEEFINENECIASNQFNELLIELILVNVNFNFLTLYLTFL